MGFRLTLGKKKIINLTIKDHVIRFVELKQTSPPSVLRHGERYLPEGIISDGKIQNIDIFLAILEECIQEWRIAKRQVRFIVPDSLIMIRKIIIPKDIKEDEIEGYLFMEIGSSIHLPFENPIFDYTLLPREKDEQELLLFAGPEEAIKEYADLLEEVKLEPISADISSLALYRLYHQQHPDDRDNIMLLQIDFLSANICIFENNKPVVARHLLVDIERDKWEKDPVSGRNDIYRGAKQEVFLPFRDVFLEIDRVRNFYNYSLNYGNKLINKIVVAGDHPWLDEVCENLANQIDIPIVMMKKHPIPDNDGGIIAPSFFLNVGLGLKEVE
nr:pilus assembly protein PilM [uncultured Bacillus sp.]